MQNWELEDEDDALDAEEVRLQYDASVWTGWTLAIVCAAVVGGCAWVVLRLGRWV